MIEQLKFSAEIIRMIQQNFQNQLETQKQLQFQEDYQPVKSIQTIIDIKRQIAVQIEQGVMMLKQIEEIKQNEELVQLRIYNKFKEDFENEFDLEFRLTPLAYDLQIANYDDICHKNFGYNFRVAEWSDLEDVIAELEENKFDSFISYLGFSSDQNDFAVKVNGSNKYSMSRYYFISWHNYTKPDCYMAHNHIQNHLLSLGSWVGSKRILCIRNKQIEEDQEKINSSVCEC